MRNFNRNLQTLAPNLDCDGDYSISAPSFTLSPSTSVPCYIPPPTHYGYNGYNSEDNPYTPPPTDLLYNGDDNLSSAAKTTAAITTIFILFIVVVLKRAQAQQPTANPTSSRNQPESRRPVPFQQESRANSTTPAPSARIEPHALRSKVVKVLFPEEKIDSSQLKFDSEANSYRWTSNNQKRNTSCSICLERFDEGDLIITGLCSHVYHREYVMTWVEANDSCPMCRQPMFDEATYKAVEAQIIHLDV